MGVRQVPLSGSSTAEETGRANKLFPSRQQPRPPSTPAGWRLGSPSAAADPLGGLCPTRLISFIVRARQLGIWTVVGWTAVRVTTKSSIDEISYGQGHISYGHGHAHGRANESTVVGADMQMDGTEDSLVCRPVMAPWCLDG